LARTIGDWRKAVDVLTPFHDSKSRPARKILAMASCRLHADEPRSAEFRDARAELEELAGLEDEEPQPTETKAARTLRVGGAEQSPQDPEALRALGDAWRAESEDRARRCYRRAFEMDPSDPDCLASYLEYEIVFRRSADLLPPTAPTIAEACQRCRNQITAGVNLPRAYFNLGRFHLFLGQPYESLAALAKAICICPAPYLLQSVGETIERLRPIAGSLPGYEWIRKLILLGMAARYGEEVPGAREQIGALASGGEQRIQLPVVIVAGGCDPAIESQMQGYRSLLIDAFKDFGGTILSGGTSQGVSGLVGDVRQHYGARLRTIGYLPQHVPEDATVDRNRERYDEIRLTRAEGYHPIERGFTPLEPLQNWIDLLADGVDPSEVKLFGINGGRIAATEFRVAAALGAEVYLLEDSGREAARIFSDADWEEERRIRHLTADPMAVRALIGDGAEAMSAQQRETIAESIHEAFREQELTRQAEEPQLAAWSELDETYRKANYGQADHIFVKLREIGCRPAPADESAPPFKFKPHEIETLARMEHGRWIVDRIRDGWRYGSPRDNARKLHPLLVPWGELSEADREKDRQTVHNIPNLLAEIGLRVRRESEGTGGDA
jgi:tetratricopeptide (TPR) repeat protein